MEITFWSRSGGSQAPVRNDVTWRPATAEDASDYARDIGTDSPTTFTARLRSGQACYLVVEGPRLLHATWASSEPVWMAETRRFVAPPRDDVYLFESFTRSEARGRGLFSFAVESISAASPGRKVWIAALDTNVASVRAIQRAGFAPAFRVRALRRLGFLRLGLPAEATAFFGGSAEGTGGP
ncbi:MAG TPA: hypothetical protein VHJ82_05740 [Actinomycetota bacterium]|nr:hypothetical protein [Actinomycetota bacterium]